MNKYLLTLTIACFPLLMLAQSPVQWSVDALKTGEGQYTLTVSGPVQPKWYVYSEDDLKQGLEAVRLTWDNDKIIRDGDLMPLSAAITIQDAIFNTRVKVYQGGIKLNQKIKITGTVPATIKVQIHAFGANGLEFLPLDAIKEVKLEGGAKNNLEETFKLTSVDIQKPVSSCGDKQLNDASLAVVFFKGFTGGLIALLMPCLFPMIPVTVSFFTNKADTRRKAINNGLLYGLSILLIYVLASTPFHLLGNVDSQIFNTIATNAWVNVAFFIIFILFALSLFGLFELRLPSSFANKAGAQSGTFFMALTLVIVSFSCTGPILGALLVDSLSNPWQLTVGMAGFGLALALPFALFAIFPQWLKSLPKSGGWLDTVKKSLAFVELALAIKFLSNADLVEHWGLLKREVFIGSWIVIALGLALYLFGVFDKKKEPVLRVAQETKPKRISGRIAFGILTMMFLFYLVPGITKSEWANLKLLSGFAPPLSYSIYGKDNVKGKGVEPDAINDYDKALALSKQTGKPILIDFTGWACVNCRKMEEQVWTKPAIKALIKEKFILVSLYVDDRQKLPSDKQFTYQSKDIITVGDKWATFQQVNFKGASQPMYVVLSPDERLMNLPVGYKSPQEYEQWLQCGLNAYRDNQAVTIK